jgi:hypothetical protein
VNPEGYYSYISLVAGTRALAGERDVIVHIHFRTLYNTKEQAFRYKLHGMAYPGPLKLDLKNLKPPALETAVHYSEGQYSIVRHTTQLSGAVFP